MLKSILKLKGVQQLTKKEQKTINGSGLVCQGIDILICCPDGQCGCAPAGTPCMLT